MVFWHFTHWHGWQEFKAAESTSFYQRWWAHWASSWPLRICGPILFQLHPHHGKGLFQHQQVASHFKSLDLFYKQSRDNNRNCDLIFFFSTLPYLYIWTHSWNKVNFVWQIQRHPFKTGGLQNRVESTTIIGMSLKKKKRLFCPKRCIQQKLSEGAAY